jgi:hypothetical protein
VHAWEERFYKICGEIQAWCSSALPGENLVRSSDCRLALAAGLRYLAHRSVEDALQVSLAFLTIQCLPQEYLKVPFAEQKYNSMLVAANSSDVFEVTLFNFRFAPMNQEGGFSD